MTPPPVGDAVVSVARTTRTSLPARFDERVALYAVVAVAGLVVGVVGGGLRILVLAVPFGMALLTGMRPRRPLPVAVEVDLAAKRCLEGDVIEGRIDVAMPHAGGIEVVIHRSTDAIAPPEDLAGEERWAWWVPPSTPPPVGLPFRIRAERWGRWSAGTIEVRVIEPGSMITHRARVMAIPDLTVLPAPQRTRQLLRLDRVPAVVGAHPTRADRADGYEFAEVREYHPGDRVRDLNWTATARTGVPSVNQRQPERAGTLVVVVDTFPDALRRHTELAQDVIVACGRIAWSTAAGHLADNDRVGMLVASAGMTWLPPQAGRRAPFVMFETLLRLTSSTLDVGRAHTVVDRVVFPPGAAIVVISPLERKKTIELAQSARARGHRVEAVAVDVGPATRARLPELPAAVSRLRDLDFDMRTTGLRRQGIATRVVAVEPRPEEDGR